MDLNELKKIFRIEEPTVEPLIHGWQTHEKHFDKFLKRNPIVVEIGAWTGKTTRMLIERYGATVICIDTWEGGIEHQVGKKHHHERLGILYETFCANLWGYRDNVAAIRLPSNLGLNLLHLLGFRKFDLIYIDGSHRYDDVVSDLYKSLTYFSAKVCGDDYNGQNEVSKAVRDVCSDLGKTFNVSGRFYDID